MGVQVVCKKNGNILFFCLCGFCDMFDGAIARTRKRTEDEKRFGIQIDSLSDLVSFGVFPAVIGYSIGLDSLWHMPLLAGYMLAALIRLAYFNVMEENRQKTESGKRKEYDGLPVTTSSLFFPFVYLITMRVAPNSIALVYGITMAMLGIFFIAPIKVKKLSVKENLALALVAIGIVGVIYMLVGR